MSLFFETELRPFIISSDVYNQNIENITNYHLTEQYSDDIANNKKVAYEQSLKYICDQILKHFNTTNNDIDVNDYDLLSLNISHIEDVDKASLITILDENGYICNIDNNVIYIHT